VLVNDTVQNAAPKLIASVAPPLYGTATTNANQTVHYTPSASFTGTDGFGYVLTDGSGSQFSMLISGSSGQVYQVEVSTNLTSWSAVDTLANVTGTVSFTEPSATNASRFYRAKLMP